MTHRYIASSALLAALVAPAATAAPSFPAASRWADVTRQALPMEDDIGYSYDHRDIVGGVREGAAGIAGDDTYVYFRLRVDGDPVNDEGFLRYGAWAVELDTDGALDAYEVIATLSTLDEEPVLQVWVNDEVELAKQPVDPAETLLASYPARGYWRVLEAPTTWSSTPDFFVDWAVPVADLERAGVDLEAGFRMVFGTTNDVTRIDGDLLSGSEASTLQGTISDVHVCLQGEGCVPEDGDGDESGVGTDNCPGISNPDQADLDGDDLGDVCDDDVDGDGVLNDADNCPQDANADQADLDRDTLGDVCDPDPEDGLVLSGDGLLGCSSAGGGGGASLLGVTLLAALMRRRRAAGLAAGLAAAAGGVASAQEAPRLSVDQLQPAAGNVLSYHHLYGTDTPGAWKPVVEVMQGYAYRPLILTASTTGEDVALIEDRLQTDVLAGLGLGQRVRLGVALPVVGSQSAGTGELSAMDLPAQGLGDVRVSALGRVVDRPGVGVAVAGIVSLPTGDEAAWMGDAGPSFEPRLVVEGRAGDVVRAGVNVGYVARVGASSLYNLDVGDEVSWGAGVLVRIPGDRLDLSAEAFGRLPVGAEALSPELAPAEADVAARVRLGDGSHLVTVGGGPGLSDGYGTPRWRGFVSYAWAPGAMLDADDDGLADKRDQCVDAAEDHDGWEDEDGCPDWDRDGDGIADEVDACADLPEDEDGWEDGDGCPDDDHDHDGLVNDSDPCPEDAEDVDGFQDEDGCSDPDNDGDGLSDESDGCPLEAEVLNGLEDWDGCPDVGGSEVRFEDQQIELLDRVYFDFDDATLVGRSAQILNQVADLLEAHPEVTLVRVYGWADEVGDPSYNLELSQHRAEAVVRYLASQGIDRHRLDAVGRGMAQFQAGESATMRRVEFAVVEIGGRAAGADGISSTDAP